MIFRQKSGGPDPPETKVGGLGPCGPPDSATYDTYYTDPFSKMDTSYMRVVVKQHRSSDGRKSKRNTIASSSLLDKFGINDENADDIVASEKF